MICKIRHHLVFHFSSSQLGGVVKPNDGLCHMEGEQATQNDDGTVDYEAYATLVSLWKSEIPTNTYIYFMYIQTCIYTPAMYIYMYMYISIAM